MELTELSFDSETGRLVLILSTSDMVAQQFFFDEERLTIILPPEVRDNPAEMQTFIRSKLESLTNFMCELVEFQYRDCGSGEQSPGN